MLVKKSDNHKKQHVALKLLEKIYLERIVTMIKFIHNYEYNLFYNKEQMHVVSIIRNNHFIKNNPLYSATTIQIVYASIYGNLVFYIYIYHYSHYSILYS